jgi:hypothetical protein
MDKPPLTSSHDSDIPECGGCSVEDALDAVLRRAVQTGDDALIATYRHIWQLGRKTDIHTSLRLGLLIGRELSRATASTDPQPTDQPRFTPK